MNVAQVVGSPSALVVDRAEGNYLYDAEGKAYLDFISGFRGQPWTQLPDSGSIRS